MNVLDSIAPFDTAEEWDNSGLQVGDPGSDVRRVIVALDATQDVIDEAVASEASLIVTHHPLIMKPLLRLDLGRCLPSRIETLVTHGIGIVSMHTNLDRAPGGTADTLAGRLGLEDTSGHGYLRVGKVTGSPSVQEWLARLGLGGARICDARRRVEAVGACPGSGMGLWEEAFRLGCDTFVTGDVRYHDARDAVDAGMNVVDLGHFATEELVVEPLARLLKRQLKGVEVVAFRGKDVFASLDNTN